MDRRVERALGVAPSDLDTSRWAQWGNARHLDSRVWCRQVGLMARKQASGSHRKALSVGSEVRPGRARLVATWRPGRHNSPGYHGVLRDATLVGTAYVS